MRTFWLIVLVIGCCVAVRGFLRTGALAGHDTVAYYVSQSEFHENIREGVLYPRWLGDGRYGYGEIKLQHRPPFAHFLAEPFIFLTGRKILGTHIAVGILVFLAGSGMYLLTRRWLGVACAVVAGVSFVTANYVLSNLYLRGAWYEVAAYSAMPWILWANENLCRPISPKVRLGRFEFRRRPLFFCLGLLAWAALICGHPQTGMVFAPVAATHVLMRTAHNKSWKGLGWTALALLGGLFLSAPYWLVFRMEMPFVRMQLYDLGLQSYFRNFLPLPSLIFESWPQHHQTYSGAMDYLGRPMHFEMRGLNLWAMAAIIAIPVFWFIKGGRSRSTYSLSLLLYFWMIVSIAFALPMSWGIWERLRILQYFNFPWRSLGVTSFCLSILTAIALRQSFLTFRAKKTVRVASVSVLLTLLMANAWPHTQGWAAPGYPNELELQPERLRLQDGIPQHLHTPRWVTDYPKKPATEDVEILDGQGTIKKFKRNITQWSLDLKADTPVVLQFNHHYYPGWRLESTTLKTIDAEPSPTGLMQFGLPPGQYSLNLVFGTTPVRTFASVLSSVALIAMFITLFYSAWKPVKAEGSPC